ncbi:valyl-trna synthetase : Valine--tRNA ligase OS=Planctomyces limnophilus (strain ATCC 43296 / DSM 3776 / IFAM 1008 / 290) GN=valS PE=3 SV=1: tRNA-synt_1: Anticodon_1: Val_tRNA-synt_C [Gemmataceae bacterium]|nr:valyl-trna synthetase : Valine--tRNA ligase OS=Planctomyces limnophilus (strain ATCC 43296 / DSM 3776 / IFAM 1008 / 290) GN=valS PE=3 SV=1: tRNA-synt_1: Anticodon_1: Val_tRNA-synt_C [Gemmataceae bacterium]VTT99990.1 valyl-trna synthetase : Valine--tRNA ligase OS=Planctomyces limnophilus (strain ATCC 43296 / DSM 3776 / IFAM 1008 / 290) GN=valS PE=3 SV=1: tRNA-synt_1: Anticodon_1: Val_tRNA-synt_C [Gemmataceae bacterium]
MATELPKAYDPKAAQEKWLTFWEQKGYFHSEPDPAKKPYTIVIPPPNVTGALHMGHALNNTLQDVLIRWRRMQGYNALWMPGTDHAGIATQAVVERQLLQQEKKTRHDLGRDELVKRIWQWKDQYEARILGQLREIGASCDWKRTRFTLDPVCARAVRETFFKMFRDGYIYRGKRLVNWDTHLQTSVADDETDTVPTKSGFWTFKYQVLGEPGASATGDPVFISFSTTRPETMLGDTAVCVHPSDERYKALVGKLVLQPHTGRKIPIIADGQLADPELGTGCVKVTPAHDPNDYACWVRHPEIGIINILNPDGTINDAGGEYKGLDRYKAREAVTKKMEELGLYVGKEDREVPLKISDRSKTPIEPYLSDQWFVKMADRTDGKPGLAQMAMDAVTGGRVKFFPERYADGYLAWLGEKRDWCISRQLWWGHRIAVWSRTFADQKTFEDTLALEAGTWASLPHVAWTTQDDTRTVHICLAHDDQDLIAALTADGFAQSDDVLDTWFSSALWPHSTLGWPGPTLPETNPQRKAPDWDALRSYYPTSTLVTSRDIISLWVARMVITGLYNVGNIPFSDVYIHPQMQDAFGNRMSKTTGNGIDPLDIVDRYGADALRYQMVALAGDTQDSRMPVSNVCPHCDTLVPIKQEHLSGRTKKLVCPNCKKPFRPGGPWTSEDPELITAKQASDRFDQGRNFANKMWNATRFMLMNLDGYTPGPVDVATLPTEDRWLLSRLATTTKAVTAALEAYRFSDVARLVYDFVWSEFCDWYIEMSKGRLKAPATRAPAQRVLTGVLDGILRLVQPVMPFVAESLWHALGEVAPERGLPTPAKAEESVAIAKWPTYPDAWIDAPVEARFARMQDLVRSVREVRNRYQVDDKTKLDVTVKCADAVAADFNALAAFIGPLAGIATLTAGPNVAKPKQAGGIVRPEFEAYVSLVGLIDPAAEIKRLEKQMADKRKTLDGTRAKLSNEKFVSAAPPEVVQQQRELVADLEKQLAALEENLKDLQTA